VRVLDFTRVLAGPHCVKILRDLGASVIKIEPPSGDLARLAVPISGGTSHYYAQQNAGKRNVSIDLNFPSGREIVMELCERADVIVENFRPGTLAFYGLDYRSVADHNPRIVYVSVSGYGQAGPWRNRAGFAPTVQAETGFTEALLRHFSLDGEGARNDFSSHADVYTGLEAAIATLAALQQRNTTGLGQHVDVAMAATMLAVNERLHAQLSDIDTEGEPVALSASDSPIIELPGGVRVTIAGSPVYTPIFHRYCAIMRRTDLLSDRRFLTPHLRKENEQELLAEVRNWLLTFSDFEAIEAQVKVGGLAFGVVRTTEEFIDSEWSRHRRPVVEVDDGAEGVIRVPRSPWLFSEATLPAPKTVARRGEHNFDVLSELGLSGEEIKDLEAAGVLSSDP
jgi:crotonobetainyl-CoA:carnitine CoA-transferase CaiB-like acyl-CoA transferase